MAHPSKRWSGAFAGTGPTSKSGRTPAVAPLGTQQRRQLLQTLRTGAPGGWTDNRLEQSQHLVGAVYVAVKVLADQAASAVVNCYRLDDDAKSAEDQDAREALPHRHQLSQLMRHPNPRETGGMWRRRVVNQLCLTGSAVNWRLDNELGMPSEVWNIETATAQPILPSPQYPEGGYRVTPYYGGPWLQFPGLLNCGGVEIPRSETFTVGLPHPLVRNDWLSPLTASALQLDALETIDKGRWHGMKQGVNPSAVVEVDPTVAMPEQEELERMIQQLAARYGGPENSGRIAVLSPGLKMNPWGRAPADMGWESSWSQLVDFVLSVFGANKSLAMMTTEQSYASLYASLKQFNLFTLCPLLQMVADVINVSVVWPFFGREYFVEFAPAAIDDEQVKAAEVSADDAVGIRTINERRAMRKLPPVDWGDIRAQPGSVKETDPGASLADTDPDNDDRPAESAKEVEAERPETEQGEGSLPGRLGKSLTRKSKDAEGHEHGGDGKFTSGGGGRSSNVTEKPTAEGHATEKEAHAGRQADHEQRRAAVASRRKSVDDALTEMRGSGGKSIRLRLRASEAVADAAEKAGGAKAKRAADRAKAVLAKASDVRGKFGERAFKANKTLNEIIAERRQKLGERPTDDTPAFAEARAKLGPVPAPDDEAAHDAWQEGSDKIDADLYAAQSDYDGRESAFDEKEGAARDARDKIEEAMADALDDLDDKASVAAEEAAAEAHESLDAEDDSIDDEEDADPEPEEPEEDEPEEDGAAAEPPQVTKSTAAPANSYWPRKAAGADQEIATKARARESQGQTHIDFDSAKHPRGSDGKFGSGSGSASAKESDSEPKPEKKEYGKSKAKVKVWPGSEKNVASAMKRILPGVKTEDVASLVGAPDDAEVTVVAGPQGMRLNVTFTHPDIQGEAKRYFGVDAKGKQFVHNELFVLKPGARGKNIGMDIFARQVEQCAGAKMSHIECHAARYNTEGRSAFSGYYVWPLYGYDCPLDDLEPAKLREVKAAFPEAENISDVMATKAGREWWGKNGDDLHDARFDLAEDSRSRKTLAAYVEAKKGGTV